MDSSSAAQSGLLVAVEGGIGYKGAGKRVLKSNAVGSGKKPYQKPSLRVYGDIRVLTETAGSTSVHRDRPRGTGFPNKTR